MRKTIEKLIKSSISATEIGRQTGVPESTIRMIRGGSRKLENITLGTAEKLYDYAVSLDLDKND